MTISVTDGGVFKEVAYGCVDIDLMFGLMGIARYGTQSYLPAGVAGSFEGASRRNSQRNVPMVVEDDGTVTILRNATNGELNGAYYSYYTVADSGALIEYRPTNARYLPKFLPNHKPEYVAQGSEGVFLGMAKPNAGGDLVPFIALTSGTLNQDLHVGCVLNWTIPDVRLTSPVIDGNYVYIFNWNLTGIQLNVWRVAIADIRANETVTPTQITGWTTTRSWAPTVTNNDKIILAEAASSLNNPGQTAYVSNPDSNFRQDGPNYSGMELRGASNGAGKIRLRLGSEYYTVTTDNGDQRAWWQLSLVVDVNAKTATPDAGVNLPIQVTYNPTTKVITRTGAIVMDRGIGEGVPLGNWYPSLAFNLVKGKLYAYGTPNEGVGRLRVSNLKAGLTSVYDALLFNNTVTIQQDLLLVDAFGSAVGGELRKPHLFPNNYIMTYGFYNSSPGVINSGWVMSKMGADGFAYNTLAGDITGFAPTVDRVPVSAAGYIGGISEVMADGSVTYTPTQLNSGRLSCPMFVNERMTASGPTISVTQAVLDAAANTLIAAAGITAATFGVSLFASQRLVAIPAIITVMVIATDGTAWSIIGTGVPNPRTGGAITSIGSVTYSSKVQTGSGAANRTLGLMDPAAGNYVYEGTDCYIVSITGRHTVFYPGNANNINWRGYFSKSAAGTLNTSSLVALADYSYINNQDLPMAIPGSFGHVAGAASRDTLSGTAILYTPTCTNMAGYNTWADGATKMLVSQIVAQGWYVYFTEQMPLFSKGRTHTLPIVTVDLTTIKANPANSTFYAYAQALDDGTAQYLVLATPAAETDSYFHIGNIYTNATQVASHTITKTTMFGGKHLSPTRRGNSIPVSSGNPAVGGGEYLW